MAQEGETPKDVVMEKPAEEKPAEDKPAEGEDAPMEEAAPEEPKEKEEDAPEDKRKKIVAKDVDINMADSTLNVLPTAGGKLLMSLTDAGFQYLLAGARTTVGVKAGRYLFEAKIIESLSPSDGGNSRQQQTRQVFRVGVSKAGSSLFLGDGQDNVCFDSEGYYAHDKSWKRQFPRVGRGQTLGVLVNLDAKSPNANTISLFVDGARVTEPQALPENLVGQALFPTITYRNVTVQTNFSGTLAPLPFKCCMLGEAAAADVEKAALLPKKAGEKVEVFFPVGLPDAGFFEYVDQFLAKHPDCTELSDRMLATWAAKSGYGKAGQAFGTSDKPELKTGVAALDDLSVRKVLRAVAPTVRRNFLFCELKSNLVAGERKQALLTFPGADFKKTALVAVGEPSADYRQQIQAQLLAEKTTKVEEERRKKKQQEERAKAVEEKRKEAAAKRKAAQEAAEKKAAEKKAAEEKEGEEGKDEEKKEGAAEEEKKEEAKEEEKKEEEEEKKEEPEGPIELDEEEKKIVHRQRALPDMNERVLSKAFADFSLPTKAEGFDGISYVWQNEADAGKLVKSWVLERKLTQKVDDLQPGDWFKAEWSKWQAAITEWRKVQNEFKDPFKRKAKLEKKKEEAAKAAAEAGDEKAAAEAPMEIDSFNIEPADVKDVTDLGNGEPLFAHFQYEDWALLSIRYELHLLLHAFKQDLNDSDRPSFPESHFSFYYNKYFKKNFNLKTYEVEAFAGFLGHIQDAIAIDQGNNFLKTLLPADKPITEFVKMTEENRRERQMLVDAGDETAKLKFTRPAPPPPPSDSNDRGGGKGGYRGGGGGGGSGQGYKRQHQGGPSSSYQDSGKRYNQGYSRNDGGYSRR